jgi:hypothetical protein
VLRAKTSRFSNQICVQTPIQFENGFALKVGFIEVFFVVFRRAPPYIESNQGLKVREKTLAVFALKKRQKTRESTVGVG